MAVKKLEEFKNKWKTGYVITETDYADFIDTVDDLVKNSSSNENGIINVKKTKSDITIEPYGEQDQYRIDTGYLVNNFFKIDVIIPRSPNYVLNKPIKEDLHYYLSQLDGSFSFENVNNTTHILIRAYPLSGVEDIMLDIDLTVEDSSGDESV